METELNLFGGTKQVYEYRFKNIDGVNKTIKWSPISHIDFLMCRKNAINSLVDISDIEKEYFSCLTIEGKEEIENREEFTLNHLNNELFMSYLVENVVLKSLSSNYDNIDSKILKYAESKAVSTLFDYIAKTSGYRKGSEEIEKFRVKPTK